jgi:hypothetical protein
MFQGDDFDADISVRILHEGEDHPTTRETLENLGLGGVRTITSESWGVFDSHSASAPLAIS